MIHHPQTMMILQPTDEGSRQSARAEGVDTGDFLW